MNTEAMHRALQPAKSSHYMDIFFCVCQSRQAPVNPAAAPLHMALH